MFSCLYYVVKATDWQIASNVVTVDTNCTRTLLNCTNCINDKFEKAIGT